VSRLPPIYPVAIAVAYPLTVFAGGAWPAADLVRPLSIAIAIALIVQVVATVIVRDGDVGGLIAGAVIAALPGSPIVFVALLSLLAFLTIPGWLARARGGTARPVPWRLVTGLMNLVAVIALAVSAGQLLVAGRLQAAPSIAEALAPADATAPDIYLILLDGHPRVDTLAGEFGYDEAPFLAAMEGQGFEVARDSRSNYNMTELTLASMFQMRQLPDVPAYAASVRPNNGAQANSLLLSGLIAAAPAFDELHRHGYQVVRLANEFTWLAIPADGTVAGGQINDFEIGLLTASRLRELAPDQVRDAAAAQHRDRLLSSFDQLAGLAKETSDHPRFVFAHIVSPHSPPVLGPPNAPRSGWPCFPVTCLFWVTGEPSGHDDEVTMMRDEVAAVDDLTLATVRSIVRDSRRPAVVVVMSDHGGRNDLSDQSEMVRSMFLARTPGHPGLFPSDTTPVNLVARLLDAYAGANLPLATEESYWTDLDATGMHGFSGFVRVDPDLPGE
jgi:hypothetical protein